MSEGRKTDEQPHRPQKRDKNSGKNAIVGGSIRKASTLIFDYIDRTQSPHLVPPPKKKETKRGVSAPARAAIY